MREIFVPSLLPRNAFTWYAVSDFLCASGVALANSASSGSTIWMFAVDKAMFRASSTMRSPDEESLSDHSGSRACAVFGGPAFIVHRMFSVKVCESGFTRPRPSPY